MGSSLPDRADQGDQIARPSTFASERAILRASEPSDTVLGSLVHRHRLARIARIDGAPVSDGDIVEGEIVDDDGAAEPAPTPDADIVDADVVDENVVDEDAIDPHSLGESGVGDPAVIALLRDTTDETTRPAPSIAADPASDAPVGDVLDPPTTAAPPDRRHRRAQLPPPVGAHAALHARRAAQRGGVG